MDTETYREILSRLTPDAADVKLHVFDSVTSTNDLLRDAAANGAPEFTVFAAKQQTAGKGRQGRQFYSPPQTGLYLSILFRPQIRPEDTLALTPMAAVAAADAVEQCTGQNVQIKWVNDLYRNGKKVGGILAEQAGAYAIQEHGEDIIESIDGSLTNVIGLPVERLKETFEYLRKLA